MFIALQPAFRASLAFVVLNMLSLNPIISGLQKFENKFWKDFWEGKFLFCASLVYKSVP